MKGYDHYRSPWLLIVLLVLGGIFGSLVGQLLSGIPGLAFLSMGRSVGLPVTTLNLEVITFTVGFTFKVNLISFVGFFVAFAIYRRL